MRTRHFVLNILMTLFFLCLAQGKTYAWFHSSGNCENCPVFESSRSAENVSKTYAFLPNAADAAPEIRLYRTFPQNSFPASAGELKVDIPFNLLSTSVTNVQALIDRQVAANLRLKNIIKQYQEQQKRNAEMLKDLNIPYLEAEKNRKKAEPAPDAENLPPADVLKKKMAEVILFQTGRKEGTLLQDRRDFQPIPAGEKGRGNSVTDHEKYGRLNLKDDYLKSLGKTGAYHKNYGRDTELPWIFSSGLKLIRYLANNKIEILSWAAIIAVIGLIGTIVVKR